MADEVDLYGDLYNDAELPAIDPPQPVVSESTSTWQDSDQKPTIKNEYDYNEGQQQQQYQQPQQNQGYSGAGGAGGSQFESGSNMLGGTTLNVRPSDMPDEGKMFVGGLNWDTSDEALKAYFEQFGVVTHCTIMRDGETQRSRGFAFLTFEKGASVNAVMTREHYLDGKTIDPKRAIPRENSQKTDKLFVRSIPNSCTQESFRTYWRSFGNITDATLMMDKESGRHRGFGFVNYENVDSVERVLAEGPHMMEGQVLEVKRAQLKGEAREPGYGQPGIGSLNRPQNQNYNNNNYNNNNNGGGGNYNAAGGATGPPAPAPFDANAMAQFFQQMQWGGFGGFNPMMMMPGMQGMPGMPMMPGGPNGVPGMPGMPGMGMPGMDPNFMFNGGNMMGNPMMRGGGNMGRGGSRGGRGRGGGNATASFNAPTGPSSMSPPQGPSADTTGTGPTRSKPAGPGFHPYARS